MNHPKKDITQFIKGLLAAAILLTIAVPVIPAEQKPATTTEQKKPEASKEKPAKINTHWLTIKSGVRHNSKCRYYKNSKGRPSTKDEGRACKICGG